MYLCPHLERQQALKSPRLSRALQYVCSKLNRRSVSFTDRQNMQDSCLNSLFVAYLQIYLQIPVHI